MPALTSPLASSSFVRPARPLSRAAVAARASGVLPGVSSRGSMAAAFAPSRVALEASGGPGVPRGLFRLPQRHRLRTKAGAEVEGSAEGAAEAAASKAGAEAEGVGKGAVEVAVPEAVDSASSPPRPPLSRPIALYNYYLSTSPIVTKSLTAGVLNAAGDLLAQVVFSDGSTPFDVHRFCVFAGVGVFLVGPVLAIWYDKLARLGKPGMRSALGRMLLDQFVMAPCFITVILLTVMSLEGSPLPDTVQRIRADIVSILQSNWMLWIPFQSLNFSLVPPQYHTLAANTMSLVWNVYLSWKAH